jgi:type VI secretion system protein
LRSNAESRSAVRSLILVILMIATASCGLPGRMRSMFGGELPMDVSISPVANEESALAVELIVVYDEKILGELLKMPARTWFQGREQFLRDHPEEIDSRKWEWVPGQEVQRISVPYRIGAKRVVLFADYLVPGDHRATRDPQQPFLLVLGQSELKVEELR